MNQTQSTFTDKQIYECSQQNSESALYGTALESEGHFRLANTDNVSTNIVNCNNVLINDCNNHSANVNDPTKPLTECEPTTVPKSNQTGVPETYTIKSYGASIADKFRFPKNDPPEPIEAKVKIPEFESLQYICRVAANIVTPDLKNLYDELVGYDTSIPQITSSGMVHTQFDMKKMVSDYKRRKDKTNYVQKLRHDAQSKPDKDSVNICSAIMSKTEDTPITLPAPLQYLREMKDKNAIVSHLLELFYTNTDKFLDILKQIKNLFEAKRILKKFNKFIFLIQQNGKKVKIHKLNYFLCFLV